MDKGIKMIPRKYLFNTKQLVMEEQRSKDIKHIENKWKNGRCKSLPRQQLQQCNWSKKFPSEAEIDRMDRKNDPTMCSI